MPEDDLSDEERAKALRKLASTYFAPVCRSILSPYLFEAGFRLARSRGDGLTYRRGACILQFGYFPYTTDRQPRYALTVAIGASRGWLRKPRRIGLWQLPSPDRGSDRWHWEFRGAEQLKRSLKSVVRLLDTYGRPLWEDEASLQAVLDKEWPIYREMANP